MLKSVAATIALGVIAGFFANIVSAVLSFIPYIPAALIPAGLGFLHGKVLAIVAGRQQGGQLQALGVVGLLISLFFSGSLAYLFDWVEAAVFLIGLAFGVWAAVSPFRGSSHPEPQAEPGDVSRVASPPDDRAQDLEERVHAYLRARGFRASKAQMASDLRRSPQDLDKALDALVHGEGIRVQVRGYAGPAGTRAPKLARSQVTCPNCGGRIVDATAFCPRCGHSLAEAKSY